MQETDWTAFQGLPLSARRDALTAGLNSPGMAREIAGILAARHQGSTPLGDLRAVLEGIRAARPGIDRVRGMNTFVRTLGQPDNLATLLDLLGAALAGNDESEAAQSERSRRGRMHCVYGWAGQTLMLVSSPDPGSGTDAPRDDLAFLGYPPAEWDMSVHVWQPNPGAAGFASAKRLEPEVIVEPPHSHPFAFVSYLSKGQMRQSIYRAEGAEQASSPGHGDGGRYAGVTLQEVDGVWPPHERYAPVRIRAAEERVLLRQGDSYFMPPHAIHDVEIHKPTAATAPTITLFLCSEAIVKPKAYLADEMADFHRQNPELKDAAVALTPQQWGEKLRLVASYLRGESAELRLGDVIQCNTTYGFMHI
jgi:hypothetical protein